MLWSSGRTSPAGVLLNGKGEPLPSEFATKTEQLQPNYDVITRQDQVQIYEVRHTDKEHILTTSFAGLFHEVKDNRILPVGWSPKFSGSPPGVDVVKITQPVRKGGEPVENPREVGYDTVTYKIPRSDIRGKATMVQVGVYYQSLPPYYLRDRFRTKSTATRRLYFLASYLDVKRLKNLDVPSNTVNPAAAAMKDWRLQLAIARRPVPLPIGE
jgi:hypothetical protein